MTNYTTSAATAVTPQTCWNCTELFESSRWDTREHSCVDCRSREHSLLLALLDRTTPQQINRMLHLYGGSGYYATRLQDFMDDFPRPLMVHEGPSTFCYRRLRKATHVCGGWACARSESSIHNGWPHTDHPVWLRDRGTSRTRQWYLLVQPYHVFIGSEPLPPWANAGRILAVSPYNAAERSAMLLWHRGL